MTWERHDFQNFKRLHLDCRIKNEKHSFTVSILVNDEGLLDLYMPGRSAGAPLLLKNKTKDQLNVFLKQLGLPVVEL